MSCYACCLSTECVLPQKKKPSGCTSDMKSSFWFMSVLVMFSPSAHCDNSGDFHLAPGVKPVGVGVQVIQSMLLATLIILFLFILQELMVSLMGQVATLQNIQCLGEKILASCHPDSIITIKSWISVTKTRYEEVSVTMIEDQCKIQSYWYI